VTGPATILTAYLVGFVAFNAWALLQVRAGRRTTLSRRWEGWPVTRQLVVHGSVAACVLAVIAIELGWVAGMQVVPVFLLVPMALGWMLLAPRELPDGDAPR